MARKTRTLEIECGHCGAAISVSRAALGRPPRRTVWFAAGFLAGFTALLALAVAAVIIPQFATPSPSARYSTLSSDLQTIRSQLELYRVQHMEKGPEPDENGQLDTANFVARLTGRTDTDGKLDPAGAYGPYLQKLPTNPFVNPCSAVKFGNGPAPGDGSSQWHFDLATGKFSANDPDHAGL